MRMENQMRLPTRVREPAMVLLVAVGMGVTSLAAPATDRLLFDAVKARDLEAVQALLGQGVDVNAAEPDGASPLHWAANLDDARIAAQLIEAGADVSAANDYGVTPLSLAATNGSPGMLETLLVAGANPNAVLPTGETVLMTASYTGNPAAVRVLLAHGANIDQREGVKGQTALMWAIWQNHMDVFHALLEAGPNVTLASNGGFTPLLFAVREGNLDAVRALVTGGASVNETDDAGESALHVAVVRGHAPVARFLLAQGADPNAGGCGYTALHWVAGTWESIHSHDYIYNQIAVQRVHEWAVLAGIPDPQDKRDLIIDLLDRGADINARIETPPSEFGFSLFKHQLTIGATPFYLASLASDLPTMRLLLARGADPSVPAANGATPLIVAAGLARVDAETRISESRVLESVRFLLDIGAHVAETDEAGNAPIHAATRAGLDQAVRYLVAEGADVNARTKDGRTPLRLANGFENDAMLLTRPSTAEVLRELGGVE